MISRKTIQTLLTGAVAVTVGASGAYAMDGHSPPPEKEKCYGVAKAGANDCAAASGSHTCAGYAAADRAGDEWIAVPKGLCERLAGGSLTPVAMGTPAPAPTPQPQTAPAPSAPTAPTQ